jgi:predicted DNA-binding transcriptional regulator AlpA
MARNTSNQPATSLGAAPEPRVPVEYLTAKETADYTGLALPTLNAMRHLGTGPAFVRVSPRRVVYELAAIREYMAARTVKPTIVL